MIEKDTNRETDKNTRLIYVVEDDEGIRDLVQVALKAYSYEVIAFDTAETAIQKMGERMPDVLILDIMLPGIDGLAAVRYLRSNSKYEMLPVLMLTAKSDEVDRVVGLESGADDYLTKPFGIMELAARIKALLRRTGKREKPNVILTHDFVINVATREVTKNGEPIELTLKEFELFKIIAENPDRVLAREELLTKVWGYDFMGETRTLDMHIRTLRQKLGDDAENPLYIKTVRGVGYRLVSAFNL